MWCFTEMGHAARGCQSIVFSRAERWQTRGMTRNFTDRGGVRMFWMCSLYRLIKKLFKMVNPPNLCWEKNVLHTRGRTKISEIFQNDSPNVDSGRRKCENFFGTIVLTGLSSQKPKKKWLERCQAQHQGWDNRSFYSCAATPLSHVIACP